MAQLIFFSLTYSFPNAGTKFPSLALLLSLSAYSPTCVEPELTLFSHADVGCHFFSVLVCLSVPLQSFSPRVSLFVIPSLFYAATDSSLPPCPGQLFPSYVGPLCLCASAPRAVIVYGAVSSSSSSLFGTRIPLFLLSIPHHL